MVKTEGAKALLERLEETPEAAQLLTRTLGVSMQAVWTWKTGNRRPDTHVREAIETLLGIPAEKWLNSEEREALRRARRVAAVRAARG